MSLENSLNIIVSCQTEFMTSQSLHGIGWNDRSSAVNMCRKQLILILANNAECAFTQYHQTTVPRIIWQPEAIENTLSNTIQSLSKTFLSPRKSPAGLQSRSFLSASGSIEYSLSVSWVSMITGLVHGQATDDTPSWSNSLPHTTPIGKTASSDLPHGAFY
ncbi:hypothetical protein TNCV_228691 [Trichonephila clavipes]|nr:hypothetical protein TNCV_228691 [Trichonephila clavipes]